MLGWPEIVGIVVIVLLLFGAKKVPEMMKGLALGVKEFKKATREVTDQIEREVAEPPHRPPVAAAAAPAAAAVLPAQPPSGHSQ